jgi:hypothetical protein
MNICFTCGNNLTEPGRDVIKIMGRSAHEKFYKGSAGELEEYFNKKKTPRCCRIILTTFIENKYLHTTPN